MFNVYQSLICALAYSQVGNLAASQDLAQEAFVAAWQQLGTLREPAKLRGWLCGIVRKLGANTRRRHARRGGEPAALDAVLEPVTTAADPEALAVSREEEALLWRALEQMADTYREPLVLYYRHDRSIAEVASHLDLSEDVVRQRLSRGRHMLRDEMATMVESALTRSRPNAAFTTAVLTAIGVGSTATVSTAAAAWAGQGVAAAAKGSAGLAPGAIVGPAAGLATAWIAARLVGLTARSQPERVAIHHQFRTAITFTLIMVALLGGGLFFWLPALGRSPVTFAVLVVVWTGVLLAGLIGYATAMERRLPRIRRETGTEDAAYSAVLVAHGLEPAGRRRYESTTRLLGLPLYSVAPPSLDVGAGPSRAARGWIAIGDLAISPLLAIGGVAIAPLAIGGVTLGLVSLSVGGIAVGFLALGSLAAGWHAMGIVAVAWKGAAGVIAIAHDFAAGPSARAIEANTVLAREWFASQWFAGAAALFFAGLPLVILLCIVVPLGLLARRAWRLRTRG